MAERIIRLPVMMYKFEKVIISKIEIYPDDILYYGDKLSKAVGSEVKMKDSKFSIDKKSEFDRTVTYNLKPGYKESFGFGVSFRRK